MTARIPYDTVDLDRLERLLWILSALGLAIALVGVVGEYRGWWNDVGELLITFGTVASVATGAIAVLLNATKEQVQRVAAGVTGNGKKLDRMHEDLATMHRGLSGNLDTSNEHLENQHDVLVQIRDRL